MGHPREFCKQVAIQVCAGHVVDVRFAVYVDGLADTPGCFWVAEGAAGCHTKAGNSIVIRTNMIS